jgi:hypothetical protein
VISSIVSTDRGALSGIKDEIKSPTKPGIVKSGLTNFMASRNARNETGKVDHLGSLYDSV